MYYISQVCVVEDIFCFVIISSIYLDKVVLQSLRLIVVIVILFLFLYFHFLILLLPLNIIFYSYQYSLQQKMYCSYLLRIAITVVVIAASSTSKGYWSLDNYYQLLCTIVWLRWKNETCQAFSPIVLSIFLRAKSFLVQIMRRGISKVKLLGKWPAFMRQLAISATQQKFFLNLWIRLAKPTIKSQKSNVANFWKNSK